MKNILFAARTLDIGGIETSLVTLLNYLARDDEYKITLALEKKQGLFINDLNQKINIIEFAESQTKIKIINIISDFIKKSIFKICYGNKFDFSASFVANSNADIFMALTASENSCIWGHFDYLAKYNGDIDKVKNLFEKIKINKFRNIIFVSKQSKSSFLKVFPKLEKKTYAINNVIDYKKMINGANELVGNKVEGITTFVNIGKQEEKQKRLTRLIEAAKKLKEEEYKFRVLLVGDGKDANKYKDLVKKYNMQDEIIFLGQKRNPYPYYKLSDCTIITSDYEGYPVSFMESMVLGKPIISTDVADYQEIDGRYGMIAKKEVNDIYEKMKQFIENGFIIKEQFNPEEFNQNIIGQIKNIIEQ